MNNTLNEINSCPLCTSNETTFHSYSLGNLYSEKIANHLGIPESHLLESIYNVQCGYCSLIYKNKWFTNDLLDTLFTQLVPSHPKGWDVVSGRFTISNFYGELEMFETAINNGDVENINRYKRALSSLLDSALTNFEQLQFKSLFEAIKSEELEILKTPSVQQFLTDRFRIPAPYKRFSGFSDIRLWEYINSKIPRIKHYDEVGCPLWGLLGHASNAGLDSKYLRREENNYWNKGCVQNGTHCSSYVRELYSVRNESWAKDTGEKRDVLGFFQYLDHLNNPREFLDEVFSKYKHATIILDKVDSFVYLQHFTGFTSKTMDYISQHYQKTLHQDFKEIEISDNVLYLFTQEVK